MVNASMWVTVPRFLYNRLKIKRGVGRVLMKLAETRIPLHSFPVSMSDGRIMYLDFREVMCLPYLLSGEIWDEKGETDFVKSIVQSQDTVIDVGANVGWYSSLLSEIVGSEGKVYGFEPSAKAFTLVERTAELYSQLEVNQIALSDFEGEADLHITSDGGQSSLQTPVYSDTIATQKCRVTTLDSFLETKGNPNVSFIKCDAEGAELSIVQGASRLLGSEKPPIWMIEILTSMMEAFGNSPEELFQYFKNFHGAEYEFYWINSRTGKIEPVPETIDFRFDALFVPAWQHDKIATYNKRRRALTSEIS